MEDADDMREYWRNIRTSVRTLKKGLSITKGHMTAATQQRDPLGPAEENYFEKENALFTTQYPKEAIPVPINGRYKLHNEIDDCIVCDKCAKVCPVDCIDIEPIRSPEVFGETSDGTGKRIYAAKFDIDMAKCMFCGLCTTVCPTECLTMTNEFDFSEFDFVDHNIPFGNMTPVEIIQRKREFEDFQKQKEASKAKVAGSAPTRPKVPGAKPQVKTGAPNVGGKPKVVVKPKLTPKTGEGNTEKISKPVIKPKIAGANKPVIKPNTSGKTDAKKPVIKPVIKPQGESNSTDKPKPARPVIKPKVAGDAKAKKPVIKPVIKPKTENSAEEAKKAARPVIKPKAQNRPIVPPRKKDDSEN